MFLKSPTHVGNSFPHPVGIFCSLLAPPRCHIMQNKKHTHIYIYIYILHLFWFCIWPIHSRSTTPVDCMFGVRLRAPAFITRGPSHSLPSINGLVPRLEHASFLVLLAPYSYAWMMGFEGWRGFGFSLNKQTTILLHKRNPQAIYPSMHHI